MSTPAHALPIGAPVRLLVRPERIAPASREGGVNNFPVRVVHDRFFGSSRELELAVGQGLLKIDTPSREGIAHIHVPRDAIQFLPTN